MYRVGDGRQADVLRARVEIARMDEEVVRMGAMLAGATARLAAAADSPPDAVAGASVLPAFPDTLPALETLESLAFETRPMLAAGAADVRAASADARACAARVVARPAGWRDTGQRRMEMGVDRMGSLMIGASLPISARNPASPRCARRGDAPDGRGGT